MEETKLSYTEIEAITASYLNKILEEHKKILELREKELIKKFIFLICRETCSFRRLLGCIL